MVLSFLLYYEFVLLKTILLLVHVLECLDVGIKYVHTLHSFIFDRLETKLSYDVSVLGLLEELSQLHLVRSLDLLTHFRIDVLGSDVA